MRFLPLVLPLLMTVVVCAPAAFAHPEPKSTAPKPATAAKLPTQAEIKAMQAQMPDMNALMSGMMEIMKDDDVKSALRGSAEAMKDHMPDMTANRLDNGMPDMNAMMGAMLSMMGDDAVMGNMLRTLEPLQGEMETLMKDVAPRAAAKPAPELPPLPQP